MTDIVKVKVDGVQVMPQTVPTAVVGFDDAVETVVDGKIIGSGKGAVESVNGKTGVVVLTATDVGALPSSTSIPEIPGTATQTDSGLMSAADKKKLDGLPEITFEKVGTV